MKNLYIDLSQVKAADVRLINGFLKLAGMSSHFEWRPSGTNFFPHAVVRPAELFNEVDDAARISASGGAIIIWLVDEGYPEIDTHWQMRRPLHLDEFSALLRNYEERFWGLEARKEADSKLAIEAGPFAVCSSVTAVVTRNVPLLEVPMFVEEPKGHADTVFEPIDSAANDPRTRISIDETSTYKLVRWPPRDLTSGNTTALKLLGFLSHQSLSIDRLVVLSGVDKEKCVAVLSQLDAYALLRRDSKVMESKRPRAPQIKPKVDAENSSSDLSLIKRLRRHLGIFR